MIYFIALITSSYIYYNYFGRKIINKHPDSIKLSDKYEIYKKKYLNKKQVFYKKINKNIIQKLNLLVWKNNISMVNNEINKNIFFQKFKLTLDEINKKNHICYWILDNNINKLKDYNVVVFNLKTIYDYDNEKIINNKYLENLSKYCHKNKLIFVIISEISPENFKKYKPVFFNKNNYYSPYNYRNKMFGSVQKLEINKISEKPANITINRIILDIMNRYGCNTNELIYIDNQELANMNNFQISL